MKEYFKDLLEAVVVGGGTGLVMGLFAVVPILIGSFIHVIGYPAFGSIVGLVTFMMSVPFALKLMDATFDFLRGFFE